jgi:4-amino-4-deoxy-L-arabinose transferase
MTALAALAFAWQGARPLWEPDEGRYAAVAIEMLDSGDWTVPRLHPEVEHLTKPPLTYWAVATSMAVLGRTELAARLPNALAFTATVLLVVLAAGRAGEAAPLSAGVVYATSLGPFVAANVLTPDTLLTLWTTASFAAVIGAWSAPDVRRGRWWAIGCWTAAGLAFLTKGPPGLLVPIAAAVAVTVVGGRDTVRRLVSPAGIAVFALLAFGWYAALAHDRPGLIERLLREEVVGRFVSGRHRRSPEWWGVVTVYVPTVATGLLPWLPVAGRHLVRIGDVLRPTAWRSWRATRPATVILVATVAAPLAVMLVARSRQPLYLLPLFPPAAILLARAIPWPPRRRSAIAVVCWAVVLVALRAAGPALPTSRSARDLAVAIRAVAAGPIDEVIVVNDVNRFGLAFELGCDVEHVALDAGDFEAHVPYRVRRLADEAGLPHGRRVDLVPAHSIERYRREATRLGLDVVELGRIGKLFVFDRRSGPRSG